ncbi:tRNA pseudouridine(55) synthase TruB [Metabacillus arenae]|uniref:tRNA pseudouridine synthase B n=1 Tax=Metabacillus arenae TaxID=2771434 RepID=A0A926RWM2_9BACI|nr:tRNA pseudouridine(55) synthase TruB [Metabacillus arenae]MBD1380056.1 tRNA pseudouridine(55) synthase TruB [Metabacillus arenae]
MFEGVLLLHKPQGMTSHDCVAKLRKILKTKKIGHTGTLDPDVSGVLPICVGRATKIVEYLTSESKMYEAEVTIGFSTTTEDASGEIVEEKKVSQEINKKNILSVLESLTGSIEQIPPMYSAIKVNGKKLYEYARQGIEVERPKRIIQIHKLDLLSSIIREKGLLKFKFRVRCSKGTYIRTLAVMIGEKLGYPAHMSHLIRTESGSFKLEDCLTFEQILSELERNQLQEKMISISQALKDLPNMTINDTLAEKVLNGAVLPLPNEFKSLDLEAVFAVYNLQGSCLALYKKHPVKDGLMKPAKIFVIQQS